MILLKPIVLPVSARSMRLLNIVLDVIAWVLSYLLELRTVFENILDFPYVIFKEICSL